MIAYESAKAVIVLRNALTEGTWDDVETALEHIDSFSDVAYSPNGSIPLSNAAMEEVALVRERYRTHVLCVNVANALQEGQVVFSIDEPKEDVSDDSGSSTSFQVLERVDSTELRSWYNDMKENCQKAIPFDIEALLSMGMTVHDGRIAIENQDAGALWEVSIRALELYNKWSNHSIRSQTISYEETQTNDGPILRQGIEHALREIHAIACLGYCSKMTEILLDSANQGEIYGTAEHLTIEHIDASNIFTSLNEIDSLVSQNP